MQTKIQTNEAYPDGNTSLFSLYVGEQFSCNEKPPTNKQGERIFPSVKN